MSKFISLSAIAASLVLASPAAAKNEPLPVGTCINMGNSFEPPEELGWGGKKIDAEDFVRIKKAGFETIRLPVRWYNKSEEKAPHTIDPKWMMRITETVDQALAADLKVILNSHHFEPLYSDPEGNRDWLAAVWTQVSTQFVDYPTETLWFEIENEPHDKITNANLMDTLNPALKEIRLTNPDRPVIIGGEDWSSIDSLATLELPDDPNIHPTFHYYAPFKFTHQGASWVPEGSAPAGVNYGSRADAQLLREDVAKLRSYMERTGLTPIMGEVGAYDKHIPLEQRILYHKSVRKAFEPTGIGMCTWAYTNTFPFYDHEAGEWLPGMLGALGLKDAVAKASAKPQVQLDNPDLPKGLRAIDKALPGALMNDPTSLAWDTYGNYLKTKDIQNASIPGGQAATRYTVSKPKEVYSAGVTVPLLGDIEKGDVMTIGFFARTQSAQTDDGKGRVAVRFQRNSDPYPGFGATVIKPTSDWGWYEVSSTADQSISKKLASVSLQFGDYQQEIEIGQTFVLKGVTSIAD